MFASHSKLGPKITHLTVSTKSTVKKHISSIVVEGVSVVSFSKVVNYNTTHA